MATITPTITISSTPGLQITTSVPGMSYDALVAALGSLVFKIDTLFYGSQVASQLAHPFTFVKYNNLGDADNKIISTPINPNQFQPTLYVGLAAKGVVFDGQSNMDFLFLAGNVIQFIFYGKWLNVSDALNKSGDIDNFKSVERSMGKEGFFDDLQEREGPDPLVIEFVED